MPDKIKDAYNAVKSTGLFIDEADFREQVAKDKKAVFELFNTTKSTQGLFIDEADFDAQLGLGKQPASPSGNGGASSSVQSTPPVTPTEPSGNPLKIGLYKEEPKSQQVVPQQKQLDVTLGDFKEGTPIAPKIVSSKEAMKGVVAPKQTFQEAKASFTDVEAEKAMTQKEREALESNPTVVEKIQKMADEHYEDEPFRIKEDIYDKTSDNFGAMSKTPITEISAAYNNATKFNDESAKEYLKGLKKNLVNDYLTYLDQADPERASDVKARISEIDTKLGNPNVEEQKFLYDLEMEALKLKANYANREANRVIQTMDYDAYSVDATMYEEKIKSLKAERDKYVDANGTPKNSLGGKYQEYNSQISSINKEMEAISTEFSNYVGEDGVLKDESKRAYVEGLQLKATELEKQANDLQKNYAYLFENGRLKQTEEEKKAALIDNQLNQVIEQYNAIGEKYGVSQDKLNIINDAATLSNQIGGIAADGLKDYTDLYEAVKKGEEEKAKGLAFTEQSGEGKEAVAGLIVEAGQAIESSLLGVKSIPKIALDIAKKDLGLPFIDQTGMVDYLVTDWLDEATNRQFALNYEGLNYGENVESPYFVKKAELFGSGVGSVMSFMAGGEVLAITKMPQLMSLWGTAFVTQEGNNYQEALRNGLSPTEARLYSSAISGISATIELAVPDFKYLDDAVRSSIIQSIKKGASVQDAIKQGLKAMPESLKAYTKNMLQEGVEEGAENIGVDMTKAVVNFAEDKEIYKDLFKAETLLDAITAGAMVGGAMTALNRPDQKSPTQQSLIGAIAETTEEDVLKMATIAPENVAVITEIQGIGAGMRQLPSFTALEQTEKNFVISESFRKKQLQRAQKEAGVKDPSIEAEIEKIDNDVDAVFNGKKVGEEYEVEVSKDEKVTNVVGNEKVEETAPISTQSGIEAVQSEEIVPEGVSEGSTPIVEETEVVEEKEVNKDLKLKYGGLDKDLKGNPQKQWMKPVETSEQATDRIAKFVEASDYKGREQSAFIDRNGKNVEVKLRNDDGKWNWYEPKSKKPFASFDNAREAIKFIQEQPFWDNGELNKEGKNDAYFAKVNAEYVKRELDNGNILEDINDGKISALNAIEIIENAGLEVPKEIVEALEQSSEETPQVEPVETKVEETQEGTEEVKVEETVIPENNEIIQEPPTPTDEIDFEKGKGEEKEARRGKRINEDESYRTKLNDYVKKYTSVNVEATTALVEDYLPKYKKLVEEVGTKEANKQTVDFLLQLIAADVLDTTVGQNFVRSAFAMLAAQRIIRDAMETGDTDTATTFNTVVDALGRQGGTIAALNNSGLSLDPLLNLFKELNASQNKALSQKTKSGRTKQDVLDEIKEAADSIKKEAAEELAKDDILDEAVTTVANEPKAESKVKPSKRTRLVKERADALDALRKITSSQGFSATPQQGAQKSKDLADAILKIAKVEIQLGAYTLGEAVSKVYKQVRNYVSKQTVQEILGEVWDSELIKLSNESRREEALDVLSDAIEGRSADKLFKALAKAMKIVNPDFIKAQKKGRRITDKQALQEILADKELAETLLNQAIEHIRAEMEMNGTYLDSVQATKPSSMSDEQWNALRAKYVISKFKQFAQTVLETADSKSQEVEIAQVVKDVAKQFYSKPTTEQSIHEALQAALPNLTLPQINKIAELVEARMQKLVESRDNRRIKALVKDITDGKNDSDMMKVLAKAMWNRGAMSTFQFANLLSNYLGFKGIPQNVVSQLIALLQNTAKMPSPLARQMAMKKVNNIASTYGETVWSYLDAIIKNILVRNILSSPKTGFSGGLSVFLTFPAAITKQVVTRPIKSYRAFGNTLSGLLNGRFALKQSAKDIFIEHQVPIARELPRDANPYAKDNAWARTRKMSWKEAGAIWKQDKKKAISYNVAKALIIGNFQGRYVGFTNTINDFMSFLDYVSVSVLRDFYLGIETQRKMEMEGVGFNNNEFKQRMSLDQTQLDAIDAQVDQEILQMSAIGQPVPKNYKTIRTQQLIAQNQDIAVLERAHEKAIQAILMSEPTTLVGTTVRSLFQSVEKLGQPKVEGQMNAIGFALNRVTFPLTLFGRILIVLGEAGARYTPVFGTVVNMFPYEFTLKEGVPSIKRNADGSKMVKWSDKKGGDQREYAYRITASMAVTSLVAMFLAYAFDDEEVVDENSKPILINGEKVTRQRYNLSGFIDFYGNSPEISQEEKGALPRNAIRLRIGTNPDGTPIFKDIPIEWATPSMYGIFKSICDTRDRQRYFDEQIMIGLKDGKDYKDLVQAPRLDVSGLSMSAGINAFNTDFSGVTRIVNGIRADRGIQAAFDAIFFEPSKRLVSPRQMEDVVHQIQNMNDQERIYINYKMQDDGMEGIVEYLMKDTWFTDPFIPNRENLESLDPFGFSVKFPPIYADFMGMFGTTATYAMASHEQEHKEYYNLYKDENGVYDPQKGTFPKRYMYSEATLEEDGEKFKVKLSDDKERQISDDARREFKNLIDKNGLEKLQGYDYETRMIYLGYLWSLAKYKSVKTNLPTSTMAKPKKPSKEYMLPEDIEEKNARFLSLE